MPCKAGQHKRQDTSMLPNELHGPQPPCDGPKLDPFPEREDPILFIRLLSNHECAGQSYVFEVEIARKSYALKLFHDYGDESDVDESDVDENVGLNTRHYHGDSFYNECRAYGRLSETDQNGRLAARCYGYTTIPYKQVRRLKKEFNIEDFPGGTYPVTGETQFYGATIKDLVRDEVPLTHKRVKKMRSDLMAMRRQGIYPNDIKLSNYRDGLLVDLGSAITEPNYILKIWDEDQLSAFHLNADLVHFDEMIQETGVKTWVKAWNEPYKERLRSWDESEKVIF